MIRSDREVTDLDEIMKIVAKCDVCRIALNDDSGYPYILPLNFGYRFVDGHLELLFHSALRGRKHELITLDNRATFEMDCDHHLFSVEQRGYCTMNYASVIGHGHIEYITDEDDKLQALIDLTDRYHSEHFEFNKASIPRTAVYKLIVTSIVAKRKSSHP